MPRPLVAMIVIAVLITIARKAAAVSNMARRTKYREARTGKRLSAITVAAKTLLVLMTMKIPATNATIMTAMNR
jgi:hypothetical protein